MPETTSELLSFLQTHSAPCPRCGYELRNLTTPICPECGEALVLKVGSPDVHFFWFLAAAAPGCFSIIPAVGLLVPLWVFRNQPNGSGAPWPIYCADVFGFLSGASVLLMYRHRRKFLRLPTRKQIGFAAAVWAVHIIALVLVITAMQFATASRRAPTAPPATTPGAATP
jgi:hypothetical protein